jgi:hypothetical protein
MEISRPTAAGAHHQLSRQVRLGPGSKGRDRDPPRRRMTRSARAIAMATLAFALLKPRTVECQARPGRGDHVRAAWAARPKGRVCFLCAQSGPGSPFEKSSPACRERKFSNRLLAVAAAAMPAAAMPAEAMPAEAGVPAEAAMIPVAMIPAMVPAAPAAIIKIERAIDRIGGVSVVDVTTRLHRASGQEKTDADQERYSPRHYSAALHCSLRYLLHIVFTRAHVAIGNLHPVVDVHVVHCSAVSLGQYASTCHLLLVRREGACLGIRLAGWAFERRLKRVTG